MTLNASGTISIGGSTSGQSINLELGRSATASSNLNETELRNLANKPSGVIALSDFYSKTKPTITLDASYTADATDFFSVTASIKFQADGDIETFTTDGGTVDSGDWIDPKSQAPGLHEIRVTSVTGTGGTFTGTQGTWEALTSDRTWSLTATGMGTVASRTFTVEIRLGTTVQDSCSVNLGCTVQ